MRGDDEQSGHLFSYLSPEQRVPADHPLRTIRTMTDGALHRLSPRFDANLERNVVDWSKMIVATALARNRRRVGLVLRELREHEADRKAFCLVRGRTSRCRRCPPSPIHVRVDARLESEVEGQRFAVHRQCRAYRELRHGRIERRRHERAATDHQQDPHIRVASFDALQFRQIVASVQSTTSQPDSRPSELSQTSYQPH